MQKLEEIDDSSNFLAKLDENLFAQISSYLSFSEFKKLFGLSRRINILSKLSHTLLQPTEILWRNQFQMEFPHIYSRVRYCVISWESEYWQTVTQEYRTVEQPLRRYFFLAKQKKLSVEMLEDASLTYNSLKALDYSKKSIIDWAREKDLHEVLHYIYETYSQMDPSQPEPFAHRLGLALRCREPLIVISNLIESISKSEDIYAIVLHFAVLYGHNEALKLAIEKGAIPDGSHLNTAAADGNLEFVKMICVANMPVESMKISKYPELIKRSEIPKDPLEIFINSQGQGDTALSSACREGHLEVVEYLLSQKPSPTTPIPISALTHAVELRNLLLVRVLLSHGAKVNSDSEYKLQSLFLAIHEGYLELSELLLEKVENINDRNFLDQTYLYCAAEGGFADLIDKMLVLGADINALNGDQKKTALYIAAEKGMKPVVDILLASNADLELKSTVNLSASDIASERGHKDIVKAIVFKEMHQYIKKLEEQKMSKKCSTSSFFNTNTSEKSEALKIDLKKLEAARVLLAVFFEGAEESTLKEQEEVIFNDPSLKSYYRKLNPLPHSTKLHGLESFSFHC